MVLCLAACSSLSPTRPIDAAADAPPDAPQSLCIAYRVQPHNEPCNPLLQIGCHVGDRCTIVFDNPEHTIYHVGCVPEGTAALGSACSVPAVEPANCAFDDCVRGAICRDGRCETICDPNNPSACTPQVCAPYRGVLASPVVPQVVWGGTCESGCDPFDDNDFLGTGARPGSACGSGDGCYALPGSAVTMWTCNPELDPALVHHSPAPSVERNACAQGYEPIYADAEGSTQIDCIAVCRPLDCYAGNCGSSSANLGGAEPHACNGNDARGTFDVATATNNGDQCMYSWMFERDTTGQVVHSPTSNTVGFCIDHQRYGIPSCDALPLAGSNSATTYGCVSTTTAGIPRLGRLRLPFSASRSP